VLLQTAPPVAAPTAATRRPTKPSSKPVKPAKPPKPEVKALRLEEPPAEAPAPSAAAETTAADHGRGQGRPTVPPGQAKKDS
jgi:hypothetical protein